MKTIRSTIWCLSGSMTGCFALAFRCELVSTPRVSCKPAMCLRFSRLNLPLLRCGCTLKILHCSIFVRLHSVDCSSSEILAPIQSLSNGQKPFIKNSCPSNVVTQTGALNNRVHGKPLLSLCRGAQTWPK